MEDWDKQARWLWGLIILVPLFLFLLYSYQYSYERSRLNRDWARQHAIEVMQDLCQRQCAAKGVQIGELQGPIEAGINSEEGSKDFEFTWRAPNGIELLILVGDNGLSVGSEHWWLEENQSSQNR